MHTADAKTFGTASYANAQMDGKARNVTSTWTNASTFHATIMGRASTRPAVIVASVRNFIRVRLFEYNF